MALFVWIFENGLVGKFTKILLNLCFEPEAPALLWNENIFILARAMLYQTELRAQ